MSFNSTHKEEVKSFLKEIKSIREKKKTRKITKAMLQPFTIFKTDEDVYLYVLGIVNPLSKSFSHTSENHEEMMNYFKK